MSVALLSESRIDWLDSNLMEFYPPRIRPSPVVNFHWSVGRTNGGLTRECLESGRGFGGGTLRQAEVGRAEVGWAEVIKPALFVWRDYKAKGHNQDGGLMWLWVW